MYFLALFTIVRNLFFEVESASVTLFRYFHFSHAKSPSFGATLNKKWACRSRIELKTSVHNGNALTRFYMSGTQNPHTDMQYDATTISGRFERYAKLQASYQSTVSREYWITGDSDITTSNGVARQQEKGILFKYLRTREGPHDPPRQGIKLGLW